MSYYLTAIFKLRANNHDRHRLRVALDRWSTAMQEALDRARHDQGALIACLQPLKARPVPEGREAPPLRLGVDNARLHKEVLRLVAQPAGLHSALRMALIVAIEQMLSSWLALYAAWVKGGRKPPKPGFPNLPPLTARLQLEAWHRILAETPYILDLAAERQWAADVMRLDRARPQPLHFGSAKSGATQALAHCGLLRREDGRYFALLTLWPQNERLGEIPERARNRQDRGEVRNVRGENPFKVQRATSSMMVPLEIAHGHEHLFFGRAKPKWAQLYPRNDDFFLHVAFEFADHTKRETAGNLLVIRRGIRNLASMLVVGPDGTILARESATGEQLTQLLSGIYRLRAIKQQKGHILRGDRRAARVAEHHLYHVAHAIIDRACRWEVERIILWDDPQLRKPTPILRYRHFQRLRETLEYLTQEAGLPAPQERQLYGPWRTCPACGWVPGDPVRFVPEAAMDGVHELAGAGADAEAADGVGGVRQEADGVDSPNAPDRCLGCGRVRDAEYDLCELLAADHRRHLELREGLTAEKLTLPRWLQAQRESKTS